MRKVLKVFFIALLLSLALFAVTVVIVTHSIDPNSFKPAIIETVAATTGRELHFGGDIEMKIFPFLQVSTTNLSLSNADGFSPDNMIEIAEVKVGVRVIPLIRKRIEVNTLSVNGLKFFYTVNEDNVTNIGDMQALLRNRSGSELEVEQTTLRGSRRAVFYVDLENVKILSLNLNNISAIYENQMTGMTIHVNPFNMHTGIIAKNIPVPIDIDVKVLGDNPGFIGDLSFKSTLIGNFNNIHLRNTTAAIKYAMPSPRLQTDINIVTEGAFNTETGILDLTEIRFQTQVQDLQAGNSTITGNLSASFSGSFDINTMVMALNSNKFRVDAVNDMAGMGNIRTGSNLSLNASYDMRTGIINVLADLSGTVRTDINTQQNSISANVTSSVDGFFDLRSRNTTVKNLTISLGAFNYRSGPLSANGSVDLTTSGVFYPATMMADLKNTVLNVDAQNFRILSATFAGTANADFDGQYGFKDMIASFSRLKIDMDLRGTGRFQPQGSVVATLETAGLYDIRNFFLKLNNAHFETTAANISLGGMNMAGQVRMMLDGTYDILNNYMSLRRVTFKGHATDSINNRALDTEFVLNGAYDIRKNIIDMTYLNMEGDMSTAWMPAGTQTLSAETAFVLDIKRQTLSLKESKLGIAGADTVVSGEFNKLFSAPEFEAKVATGDFSPRETLEILGLGHVLAHFKPEAFIKANVQSVVSFKDKVLKMPARVMLDGTKGTAGVMLDFTKTKLAISANVDIDKADIGLYLPTVPIDNITANDAASLAIKENISDMELLIAALYNPSLSTNNSIDRSVQIPVINLMTYPNVQLAVTAKKLTWGQQEFQTVALDATLTDGILDVEKVSANIHEGKFVLRGTVVGVPNRYEITVQSGLSYVDLSAMARVFGIENLIKFPTKVSLFFDAEYSNNLLIISSMIIRADEMTANLNAEVNFGRRPAINFTLGITEIDLGRYIPEQPPKEQPGEDAPVEAAADAGVADNLTEEKKPLEIADIPVNIIGRMTIQSLRYKNFSASNIVNDISLQNGRARVRANMSSFGGTIDASLTATGAWNHPVCAAVMNINLIRTEAFIKMLNNTDNSFLSGFVTANADVTATGILIDDVLRSLNGRVIYSVRDAVLNGIGYDPNILSLERVRSFILLDSTRQTEINNFNGELIISDGVVFVAPVTAISRNIILNISGYIGLYDRTFNLDGSVNLGGSQDAQLSITGAMSDPDVYIDQVALRNGLIMQITRSTGRGIIAVPMDIIEEIRNQIQRGFDSFLPEDLQR